LIAAAKLAAVNVSPVFDFMPFLIVNTYVRPSFETDGKPTAASGAILLPTGSGWSG